MLAAHEADQLATRARRGEAAALTRLYREYAPPLLAYLQRLLGDREVAEDILQETFLHLIEGRGPFRERGRFRPWLFAVASNRARDFRRRERSRRTLVESLAEAIDREGAGKEPAADDVLQARETLARIEAALEDLPRGYAAAFHLRVREEFSYREMAVITGESEGTLRSRVHHTLRRLRDHLVAADARRPDRHGSGPETPERNDQR